MRPLRKRGWRAATPFTTSAPTLFLIAAGVAALAAISTGPATAARHDGGTVVSPRLALAVLLGPHAAMSAPTLRSDRLQLVSARRPITDERTVLPVIGHRSGNDGSAWLHVVLPGRPNGHTGWIKQRGTSRSTTVWHLVVDTATRRVTVYREGRAVRVFKAVVGKPATPTPHGEFFVEEVIQLSAADPGAPYALALSARSNVLQEFEGGPGQIALHGLMNVGGVLGSAASHGCVRLANDAMRWLVIRISPGVPVTITR